MSDNFTCSIVDTNTHNYGNYNIDVKQDIFSELLMLHDTNSNDECNEICECNDVAWTK